MYNKIFRNTCPIAKPFAVVREICYFQLIFSILNSINFYTSSPWHPMIFEFTAEVETPKPVLGDSASPHCK
jgi:hypothetical protein